MMVARGGGRVAAAVECEPVAACMAARRLAVGAARLDCKSDSETSPERVIAPSQQANVTMLGRGSSLVCLTVR